MSWRDKIEQDILCCFSTKAKSVKTVEATKLSNVCNKTLAVNDFSFLWLINYFKFRLICFYDERCITKTGIIIWNKNTSQLQLF